MKLDAGDLETFVRVNRPCEGVDYWSILNGLKSLGEVTLQTMFVDGIIRNIGDQEVRQWIERVGEIQPLKVQIYSLHRLPAELFLRQVPVEKLSKIAVQTEKATGVLVEVISGHPPYRKKTSRLILMCRSSKRVLIEYFCNLSALVSSWLNGYKSYVILERRMNHG